MAGTLSHNAKANTCQKHPSVQRKRRSAEIRGTAFNSYDAERGSRNELMKLSKVGLFQPRRRGANYAGLRKRIGSCLQPIR